MTHHIDLASRLTNQANWSEQSPHAMVRLLGKRESVKIVGVGALIQAIESGQWQLSEAEKTDPQGNVLHSFLSGRSGVLHDISTEGRVAYPYVLPKPEVEQLVRVLVEQGCDPKMTSTALNGADAIDLVFTRGILPLVDEWIGEVDWQSRKINGKTWMELAAGAGQIGLLDILHLYGGDVSQVNEKGETPLFRAGNEHVVRWLIDRGADPNHRNQDGANAISFWRGTRSMDKTRLEMMVTEAGPLKAPEQANERVRIFIESAKSGPVNAAVREAKRLKITGSERGVEGGIVRAAVQRSIDTHNKNTERLPTENSKRWLVWVSKWKEAMEAATIEELGLMAAAGRATADEARENAQNELKKRLPDPQERAQVERDGVSKWIKRAGVREAPAPRLLRSLTEEPGFLDTHPQLFTEIVGDQFNGNYLLYSDLHGVGDAFSQEDKNSPGWQLPGLVLALTKLALGEGFSDDNKGIMKTARLACLGAAAVAVTNGAAICPEASRLLEDKGMIRGDEFELAVRGIYAAQMTRELDQATPGVGEQTGARKGLRL